MTTNWKGPLSSTSWRQDTVLGSPPCPHSLIRFGNWRISRGLGEVNYGFGPSHSCCVHLKWEYIFCLPRERVLRTRVGIEFHQTENRAANPLVVFVHWIEIHVVTVIVDAPPRWSLSPVGNYGTRRIVIIIGAVNRSCILFVVCLLF